MPVTQEKLNKLKALHTKQKGTQEYKDTPDVIKDIMEQQLDLIVHLMRLVLRYKRGGLK